MTDHRARMLRDFVWASLNEAGTSVSRPRTRLSSDSVDDQIDSILLGYESDCIVSVGGEDATEVEEEGIIREAPEDEEPAPKPELGSPEDADDEQVQQQTGDQDDEKPDEEADPLQPKIDLHKFCGKVSRLATNYDALLDMPIAIVNRAYNYLAQNYSGAVADEFAEIMERDFDIELEREPGTSEPPREAPMAVGAAATGLGGGG